MKRIILVTTFYILLFTFNVNGQIKWKQLVSYKAQVEQTTPAPDDLLLIENALTGKRMYVKVSNLTGGGDSMLILPSNYFEKELAINETVINTGFAIDSATLVFVNGDILEKSLWDKTNPTEVTLAIPVLQYDKIVVYRGGGGGSNETPIFNHNELDSIDGGDSISNFYGHLTEAELLKLKDSVLVPSWQDSCYHFEKELSAGETVIIVGFVLDQSTLIFINGDILEADLWTGLGTATVTLLFPVTQYDKIVVHNNGTGNPVIIEGGNTQPLATDGTPGNIINSGDTIVLNVNDADPSPTNELQTLSLNGNDLSISNGNTLALPTSSGDVIKIETPINNQVGVWTGDGTIEGDPDFTFDGKSLTVDEFAFTLEERWVNLGARDGALSASITMSGGANVIVTMDGDLDLHLSNIPDGGEGRLQVIQDASGNHSFTLNGGVGYTTEVIVGHFTDVLQAPNFKTNIKYWRSGSVLYYEILDGDLSGGGTITGITAGLGLQGGGTSGSVPLSLLLGELANNTTATTSDYIPWIDVGSSNDYKMTIAQLGTLIGGGDGVTDLSFEGTSANAILQSSTGTDVTLTAGTNITFSPAYSSGITINAAGVPAQTLSISGSDLSISGGNTVTLPTGGSVNPTQYKIPVKNGSGGFDDSKIINSGGVGLDAAKTAGDIRIFSSAYTPSGTTRPTGNYISGITFRHNISQDYESQLAFSTSEDLYVRAIVNGTLGTWKKVWHSGNFNEVATLSEASGAVSWAYSSGNNATVTIDQATTITMSGFTSGMEGTIAITQGDSGDDNANFAQSGYTVKWRDSDKDLTNTSGAVDLVSYKVLGLVIYLTLGSNYITQ